MFCKIPRVKRTVVGTIPRVEPACTNQQSHDASNTNMVHCTVTIYKDTHVQSVAWFCPCQPWVSCPFGCLVIALITYVAVYASQ